MSKATEAAERLLAAIEDIAPFKVLEVTNPGDDPMLATVRKNDGYPVIAPHPESVSILTGHPAFFQFVEKAPVVIRALLSEISSPETANKS